MKENNKIDTLDFDNINNLPEISLNDISLNQYDNFTGIYDSDDIALENKDIFNIGNLENSHYNKDITYKKNKTETNELNKDLTYKDVTGDKKNDIQIEYTNNDFEESISTEGVLSNRFYELQINDYPDRQIINSSDVKNKSLGDNNFLYKLLSKIISR